MKVLELPVRETVTYSSNNNILVVEIVIQMWERFFLFFLLGYPPVGLWIKSCDVIFNSHCGSGDELRSLMPGTLVQVPWTPQLGLEFLRLSCEESPNSVF